MKLLIKQRVFSWTDSYDIYDENWQVRYFVKAEFFTFGHQLHIYDAYKNEAGVIRQKIFTLLPAFEIEIGGRSIGTIQRQFSFLKPRYKIDYNGWRVKGDIMGWNYEVYEASRNIIHISRELFRWGDTYVIDFANRDHELMGMMLVIAIDAANCSHQG